MSIKTNKQIVMRFNIKFLEKRNPDLLDEIISNDFRNHTASENVATDVNGMIQFVKIPHWGIISQN